MEALRPSYRASSNCGVVVAKLVLLGGPTGVGKSTALRLLENRLPKLALLDANDVWRVSTDLAVDGTRGIALSNVIGVLQGYFQAGCEVAVLGWVFARSQLYGPVISGLEDSFGEVHQLYLVASPDVLMQRLRSRGAADRWEYSVSRLELIRELPYPKIDASELEPADVANRVLDHIRGL